MRTTTGPNWSWRVAGRREEQRPEGWSRADDSRVFSSPPASFAKQCMRGRPLLSLRLWLRSNRRSQRQNTRHGCGVRGLIIHVELEVSAPFECGAMRCASSVAHREVVHTVGSDSFCGGWLIPGPQANAPVHLPWCGSTAGPYHQPASRELRGLQRDHQNEDKACSAHRYVPTPRCFSTVYATRDGVSIVRSLRSGLGGAG